LTVLNLVTSIAEIASPILYAVFIVVIYFQFRSARESVREVRQEFLAGGRPTVAVHDEYDATTGAINLVVENVGQGPAKDINFEFARPVECSDGVVISELPLYTMGLTSLSPAARITCYWDDFGELMEHLRARGLESADFAVTVRYSDLTGVVYSNEWDVQPIIYQGLRHHPAQGKAPTPAGDDRRDGTLAHDTEPSATGEATGPAAVLAGPARADGSSPATSAS
jgi:hypothetical protein